MESSPELKHRLHRSLTPRRLFIAALCLCAVSGQILVAPNAFGGVYPTKYDNLKGKQDWMVLETFDDLPGESKATEEVPFGFEPGMLADAP